MSAKVDTVVDKKAKSMQLSDGDAETQSTPVADRYQSLYRWSVWICRLFPVCFPMGIAGMFFAKSAWKNHVEDDQPYKLVCCAICQAFTVLVTLLILILIVLAVVLGSE